MQIIKLHSLLILIYLTVKLRKYSLGISQSHWCNGHIDVIFLLSPSKFFQILEHTKSYIEKIHYIDAEVAEHAHKLDIKLQSLCGSGFSLFAVHMPAMPYHLGVNWSTTHSKIKDGEHFFTLNFECYNRYNKLLLCNSKNSDIAWWNKNNSEWGFLVFFNKRTKSCCF